MGTEGSNSWVHGDNLVKDGGIGKHGGHCLEELGGIEHILHLVYWSAGVEEQIMYDTMFGSLGLTPIVPKGSRPAMAPKPK